MQAMTADEFYRGVLLGSNKGTDFDDKTNIIWFEPRIFTTIEADFLDTGIRELRTDIENGYVYNIGLPEPVPANPKDWHYNAVIKLFDSEYKELTCTEFKDVKCGNAWLNKAYITPYVTYKRRRYFGIAAAFPHLAEGEYTFSIREHWVFDDTAVTDNIVRNITIPIKVDPQYTPYDQALVDPDLEEMQNAWYIAWGKGKAETLCYLNLLDQVNRHIKFTPASKFKSIGSQSISLPSAVVPTLCLNKDNPKILYPSNYVAYTSWLGTDEELVEAYKKYFDNSDSPVSEQEIEDLRTIKKWAPYQSVLIKDLIAGMTNAHTSRVQLDHGGDGVFSTRPYSQFATPTEDEMREFNEVSFTLGVTSKE